MRLFKSLLWLLVPTVAMAATVYNYFPPPGSAYSNAAASNFDVGTTATTSAEFSVGNNPAGLTGAAEAGGVDDAALPPRILNITAPQTGHLPLMALRPFFIVSSTASAISLFALHLTQYPSGIKL